MYPFTYDECVTIMMDTMKSGPRAWFTSTMYHVTATRASEPEKMALILSKFKEQYLSTDQGIQYKSDLLSGRVTLRDNPDENALTAYFNSFNNLYLCTVVCGNPPPWREVQLAFMKGLPPLLKSYIGRDVNRMTMLDELYAAAMEALRSTKRGVPVSRSPSDVVEVQALRAQPTREEIEARGLKCFYCGSAHHIMDECKLFKSGERPTPAGMEWWGRLAKQLGWAGTYNEWVAKRKAKLRTSQTGGSSSTASNYHAPRADRPRLNTNSRPRDFRRPRPPTNSGTTPSSPATTTPASAAIELDAADVTGGTMTTSNKPNSDESDADSETQISGGSSGDPESEEESESALSSDF